MNKLFNSIANVGGKALAGIKKHSPEICVTLGIVGTGVAAVMACKATLKVNDILDNTKEELDKIHEVASNEEYAEEYTVADAKKDTAIVYGRTALGFAKLYAPAVLVEAVSVFSILAGFKILKTRNVALAAALTTVSEGYEQYRKRVVERFGEEVDKELKYGTKAKKIEEEETDPETGKTKKVKKTIQVSDLSDYSDYAIYWDQTTTAYWSPDELANKFFLSCQQNYANDMIKAKKYKFVTLKEILEAIGVLDSVSEDLYKASMVVGWKYEPDNPVGDNRIIFDVYETNRELEDGTIIPTHIIDFNVDGNIYSRV